MRPICLVMMQRQRIGTRGMVSTRGRGYRAPDGAVPRRAAGDAVVSEGLLQFEGVIAYGTQDAEEAVHFFEHTLGLAPAAQGDVRFYPLSDDLALAVDTGGGYAGLPPYLLFSTPDLDGAREHFTRRGCDIAEMGDADGDGIAGFFARAPEGHTVCIVARDALED